MIALTTDCVKAQSAFENRPRPLALSLKLVALIAACPMGWEGRGRKSSPLSRFKAPHHAAGLRLG